MAKTRQLVVQLTTLAFGLSSASLAFALATVDAEPTGAQANQTTLKLFDGAGKPVAPADTTRPNRYSGLAVGTYGAEVYVGGKLVGSRSMIRLDDGDNRLSVNSETGAVTVRPRGPMAADGWPGLSKIKIVDYEFALGGGWVSDKDAPSLGVRIGPDNAVLNGRSGVPLFVADMRFNLSKDGLPGCRWDIGGAWGDRTASTSVAPGPNPPAYAYWVAAENGSPGHVLPEGVTASLKSKYRRYSLNGVVFPYLLKNDDESKIFGEPRVGYQYSKWNYSGSLVSAADTGTSSTTDQRVKQNQLRAGWGLRGEHIVQKGFSLGAGAGIDAIYYDGKYRGSQLNVWPQGPAAERNFSVSSSGSKNGWAFGAWGEASATYGVSKDVDFVLSGAYRYTSAVAGVENHPQPSRQPPETITKSQNEYYGQVGLAFKF